MAARAWLYGGSAERFIIGFYSRRAPPRRCTYSRRSCGLPVTFVRHATCVRALDLLLPNSRGRSKGTFRSFSSASQQKDDEDLRQRRRYPIALGPDGSSLYLSSPSGKVFALESASGRERWAHKCDHVPPSILSSADGATLFAGCSDGELHAITAQSKDLKWRYTPSTDGERVSDRATPFLSRTPDGQIVFCAWRGSLRAVLAANGECKWSYRVGEVLPIDWSYAVTSDGAMVIFWAGDGALHAVDVASGERKWAFLGEVPPSSWSLLAAPDASHVFFTSDDHKLHCVATASGEQRWIYELGAEARTSCLISPDGARVLVGTIDGKLHAISVADGSQQWLYDTDGVVPCSLALNPDGALAFLIGTCGSLHAVADTGVQKWAHGKLDKRPISVATDPHSSAVFMLSADVCSALRSDSGAQLWSAALTADGETRHAVTDLLVSKDGSCLFVGLRCELDGGTRVIATLTHTGELSWQETLGIASASTAPADNKGTMSKSAWIRKKRYAVLAALVLVLELRRSGYLQRPPKGNSEDGGVLDDNGPLAGLFAEIFGSSTSAKAEAAEKSSNA